MSTTTHLTCYAMRARDAARSPIELGSLKRVIRALLQALGARRIDV